MEPVRLSQTITGRRAGVRLNRPTSHPIRGVLPETVRHACRCYGIVKAIPSRELRLPSINKGLSSSWAGTPI
jgi:hypothetical protein